MVIGIHDYTRGADPNATPGDTLPSANDQHTFWSQCQHGSWYFLPWHRMYLAYFEQVVAATVQHLGGPADWALPYWNYGDATNPNARKLPPAFRAASMPNGKPNPLRIPTRVRGNSGNDVTTLAGVSLNAVKDQWFAAQATGGDPGFGGRATLFHHNAGAAGVLEVTPHGSSGSTIATSTGCGWSGGSAMRKISTRPTRSGRRRSASSCMTQPERQ